jgi:hypothetical protein
MRADSLSPVSASLHIREIGMSVTTTDENARLTFDIRNIQELSVCE